MQYSASIEKIQYCGENVCLLALTDITNVKKVQVEAIAKKYKNILLTTASHELMTPMNGILGAMQLILRSNDIDDIKEYCSLMDLSCKNLLNITDDMLDYCLYESGDLSLNISEINFVELLNEAVKIIEIQTKQRGVEISISCDSEVPEKIRSDRKRLLQILLNLLGNSAKYTFKGSIKIIAEGRETDILIKIIDTGIGIDNTKKEKLFKLFNSANSNSGDTETKNHNSKITAKAGSGLGLTVSQVLATLLGTGLQFESNFNEGSTFWFSIEKQLTRRRCNSATQLSKFVKRKSVAKRLNTVFCPKPQKYSSDNIAIIRKNDDFILGNRKLLHTSETAIKTEADSDTTNIAVEEYTSGRNIDWSINRYKFASHCAIDDFGIRKIMCKCDCATALIVDDNAFNLFVLKNLLMKLKIKCVTVFFF